jgi:uncharacterized protein YbjT (DUF2867 family)
VILLTGGTGFIGSHVAHNLRAREQPVRALVRDRRRAGRLVAWGVEVVEGDVTDMPGLQRAVDGCDAVVHLVSIIKGRPADFERIMAQGTTDLVAAAAAAGVRRFVLASALGVQEQTKDAVPYYRAKWQMEQAVKAAQLEHVIFRPSFVFGRDGGALPMFIRVARLAPVTPIIGPGTQRLQPIWIEDLTAYFVEAISKPEAAGGTFEVGGPDAVTWDEFWTRLKRILGARRPSIHLPFGLMRAQAVLTERLPVAPVTRDQLTMLALGDNVVTSTDAVETFRLPLLPLDEQLRRSV